MKVIIVLAGLYWLATLFVAVRSELQKRDERKRVAKDEKTVSRFMLSQRQLWFGSGDRHYIMRMQRTLNIIKANRSYLSSPMADMGENNPLKEFIENGVMEYMDSIGGFDFDADRFPKEMAGQYGTVFDFEVLEHLMNPLFHLLEVKKMLKPGGVIVLSTPNRIRCLWGDYHFHEIDDLNIAKLFDRAGLQIIKQVNLKLHGPWYHHAFGIRPIMRYFTHSRVFFLKAKP